MNEDHLNSLDTEGVGKISSHRSINVFGKTAYCYC